VLRDRYRVTGTIEVGSVAAIYRAEEVATGRAVSVKVWHEIGRDDRRRAESFHRLATRGGAASGQLPRAFVAVRDCALTVDGRLFLVTELVEGPSLRQLVETGPGVEPGRALALAIRVGEALATALDLGFLELRVSPANILVVDAEDSVKILGSEALVLRRLGIGDSLAESFRRDPDYAAPEELAGEPATERSAVYGFGLLLRALLQGTLAGERSTSTPAAPLARLLPSLRVRGGQPSVSSALERLAARMTDPNPAARPSDVTRILNELWEQRCRLESAEPGGPVAPPHRWVLVAVPVLVVTGTLIAWLVVGSGRPGPSARPSADRPPPAADASRASPPAAAPTPASPSATAIAPPRATPVPPTPAPPPARAPAVTPPSATASAPPRATVAAPIPLPPPAPAPPLTTLAPPIPASPPAVARPAVTETTAPAVPAVDPAPPTASRPVQPIQPLIDEQQADPGAIIDWLLRQSAQSGR
jgi:serine/threonine protein kinase